jgi:hypothetical protein
MRVICLLLPVLMVACSGGFQGGDGGVVDGGICVEGKLQCVGQNLQACHGGRWENQTSCPATQVCSDTLGRCADCDPARKVCVGDAVHTCEATGKIGALETTCPAGKCYNGTCTDACGQAAAGRSYVGCDYWPTVTLNSELVADFSFAVVVANAQTQPATITVSSSSNASVATTTVAPNSLATIKLPWVDSLKQDINKAVEVSVLEPAGAYHLVSSLPVSVYQFNALDYVLNQDCKLGKNPDPVPGKCYSYSNDASLLLPENALTGEYMVIARATQLLRESAVFPLPAGQFAGSPGFFAVTAVKDGDTKVDVTFSADTQAGASGKLAAYNKGQTASFTLQKWGVLQIASRIPTGCTPSSTDGRFDYCDLSAANDLTGTLIKADKNVAVFSGHNCSFTPYDKWACDHLEEQMFPTRSWGKHYLLAHTDSSGTDPNLYRIVSAEAGNEIFFNPAAVHAPVKLDAGQWVEFVATTDFEVTGSGRLAVAQFMVGQNYSNPDPGKGAPGDPSMSLAVPVEQFRLTYRFLAPESYEQNYVNVMAPKAATITLDGAAIDESKFAPLADKYKVAKVKINGGSHLAESSSTFGIAVYGVGSYTSYMVPGGLDLKLLE